MSGTALAEPLRISVQPATRGVVRLAVAGEVDLATVPQLRGTLLTHLQATPRPREFELDLAETTFIDAVGVRALLEGQRAADQSRIRFALRNPSAVVTRVLVLAGVADILPVVAAPPA